MGSGGSPRTPLPIVGFRGVSQTGRGRGDTVSSSGLPLLAGSSFSRSWHFPWFCKGNLLSFFNVNLCFPTTWTTSEPASAVSRRENSPITLSQLGVVHGALRVRVLVFRAFFLALFPILSSNFTAWWSESRADTTLRPAVTQASVVAPPTEDFCGSAT